MTAVASVASQDPNPMRPKIHRALETTPLGTFARTILIGLLLSLVGIIMQQASPIPAYALTNDDFKYNSNVYNNLGNERSPAMVGVDNEDLSYDAYIDVKKLVASPWVMSTASGTTQDDIRISLSNNMGFQVNPLTWDDSNDELIGNSGAALPSNGDAPLSSLTGAYGPSPFIYPYAHWKYMALGTYKLQQDWVSGQDYHVPGSFTVTFPKAVVMDGGIIGDLKVTVSDLCFSPEYLPNDPLISQTIPKDSVIQFAPLAALATDNNSTADYQGLATGTERTCRIVNGSNGWQIDTWHIHTQAKYSFQVIPRQATQSTWKTLLSIKDLDEPATSFRNNGAKTFRNASWTNLGDQPIPDSYYQSKYAESITFSQQSGIIDNVYLMSQGTSWLRLKPLDGGNFMLHNHAWDGQTGAEASTESSMHLTGLKTIVDATAGYSFVWGGTNCGTIVTSAPSNAMLKREIRTGRGTITVDQELSTAPLINNGNTSTSIDNPITYQKNYKVQWQPQEGYVVGSVIVDGTTLTTPGTSVTFQTPTHNHSVIVNFTRQTGTLTVKKTTTGDIQDSGKKFNFTVTINDEGTGINGTYGGVNFSNGVGSFQLAHNEQKELTNIPYGCTYEVTETDDAYATAWTARTGTIANGTIMVTATNTLKRGDIKFVKLNKNTNQPMANVAFIIEDKTTHEQHLAVTDANGIVNTASSFVPHTNNTNKSDAAFSWHTAENMWVVDESKMSSGHGLWFSGHKTKTCPASNDLGALPNGTYTITEVTCTANRGYNMADPFDVTISATGIKDLGTVTNIPPNPPVIPLEHGQTVTLYKKSEPTPNSLVAPDTVITYTLLLRHTGATIQPRTIVRDYIPEGTVYVSESASDNGVYIESSPSTNAIGKGRAYVEWQIDDMTPRSERAITFQVKVLHSAGQFVFNTGYARLTDKTVIAGNPANPEPTDESNTVMHRLTSTPTPKFIRIIKRSNPVPGTEVGIESNIAYTLHVENTGGSAATNIGVYDRVPVGTVCSSLPKEYSATLSDDGSAIGWLIPSLAPQASVDLHFTVTVTNPELVDRKGLVRNQASYGDMSSMATPKPPTEPMENTTNIVEHTIYVPLPEDAETYKWSDPQPETRVAKDTVITYQLTTTNTSASTKPFVLLRDYIPEGTEYVEGSASDGGTYVKADAEGNTTGKAYVEWLLKDVRRGDKPVRTFKVKVIDGTRMYIRNHARSETIETELIPGNPSNPEPKQVTNEVKHPLHPETVQDFPYVKTTKWSSPAPGTMVDLGRRIDYELVLSNDSDSPAYDVRVYDEAPEGTGHLTPGPVIDADGKEVSAESAAVDQEAGGHIGWYIECIQAKSTVTLHFTATVISKNVPTIDRSGRPVIRNIADWSYVSKAVHDGTGTPNPKVPDTNKDMPNHTNIVEHPLIPDSVQHGSQVTAYKDSEPAPNSLVKAGDTITYYLKLKHTGSQIEPFTLVRDYIPQGTEYVADSSSNDGVYVDGNKSANGIPYVEWLVRNMSPSTAYTLSFQVKVTEDCPTFIRNLAVFDSPSEEPVPGNPDNPAPAKPTNVVWHTTDEKEHTPAVVQVVKSANPASGTKVCTGDTITYTLRVMNTGDSDAHMWGIHDFIQPGLTLIRNSVKPDHHGTVTNDGRGVAWVIEELKAGASIDLSFAVRVTGTVFEQKILQNQATWEERKGPNDIPDSNLANSTNVVEHLLVEKDLQSEAKSTQTKNPQSKEPLVTTGGSQMLKAIVVTLIVASCLMGIQHWNRHHHMA